MSNIHKNFMFMIVMVLCCSDCTCMKTMSMRKVTKVLWLSLATQLPTQGQWWSITSTQRSHTEQCLDLTTFGVRQVQQCGAGADQLGILNMYNLIWSNNCGDNLLECHLAKKYLKFSRLKDKRKL